MRGMAAHLCDTVTVGMWIRGIYPCQSSAKQRGSLTGTLDFSWCHCPHTRSSAAAHTLHEGRCQYWGTGREGEDMQESSVLSAQISCKPKVP